IERLQETQKEAERNAELEKRQTMRSLADAFQANVGRLVTTVTAASTRLHETAQSLSDTANDTSSQSQAAQTASEEASSNAQTIAAAAEELNATVNEIGRQVTEAAGIAGRAVDDVRKTDATFQGLAETAKKIGNVVELINQIASQTNLLALNAT